MKETLKMMQSILTGKECKVDEKELIIEYQEKLLPNILAYFFINNFGIIINKNKIFPIINEEDKASFCLQEIDNCLRSYDITSNAKFSTYFIRCYSNRLRMETEQLLTYKRKIFLYNNTEINEELTIDSDVQIINTDIILSNYNLTKDEKKQCQLLDMGYTLKEIALLFNLKPITIYKRNQKIKQKILNYNINFA